MPFITGDFALLSYVDLACFVSQAGGDLLVDGLGSDQYFGTPVGRQLSILRRMALSLRPPPWMTKRGLFRRGFVVSYALATIQMNPFERFFPGSRFTATEVDGLLGAEAASRSAERLSDWRRMADACRAPAHQRLIAVRALESGGAFAKAILGARAAGLRTVFPYCERGLVEWALASGSPNYLTNRGAGNSKVVVKAHISARFKGLPYVKSKGSFRFDVRSLALGRFDQVLEFANKAAHVLPGARKWLEENRKDMENKAIASRFYLLAVLLPWILSRGNGES